LWQEKECLISDLVIKESAKTETIIQKEKRKEKRKHNRRKSAAVEYRGAGLVATEPVRKTSIRVRSLDQKNKTKYSLLSPP